jgi:L-alanine-DL-glutamate epimerase-like enolase superfamily enzyme
VKVPIAVGEQYGDRWDINNLIEQQIIDYSRITLPNAGGITEFMKIAEMCETHSVGLIPHFTGPISVAALSHALAAFPGPVLMEWGGLPKNIPYLPQNVDFHDGKLWPRSAPGIGVEFDSNGADHLIDITEHSAPIPLFKRPDGSMTNW